MDIFEYIIKFFYILLGKSSFFSNLKNYTGKTTYKFALLLSNQGLIYINFKQGKTTFIFLCPDLETAIPFVSHHCLTICKTAPGNTRWTFHLKSSIFFSHALFTYNMLIFSQISWNLQRTSKFVSETYINIWYKKAVSIWRDMSISRK